MCRWFRLQRHVPASFCFFFFVHLLSFSEWKTFLAHFKSNTINSKYLRYAYILEWTNNIDADFLSAIKRKSYQITAFSQSNRSILRIQFLAYRRRSFVFSFFPFLSRKQTMKTLKMFVACGVRHVVVLCIFISFLEYVESNYKDATNFFVTVARVKMIDFSRFY